jgi:DNA-binding transcriptional regulator YdaS (Cro superfamily)
MKILQQIKTRCGNQKKMANELGFPESTVSDWMRGAKPMSFKSINAVAAKTGFDPGELFKEMYPVE